MEQSSSLSKGSGSGLIAALFCGFCFVVWCPTVKLGTLGFSPQWPCGQGPRVLGLCRFVKVLTLRDSSCVFLVGLLGLHAPQGNQHLEETEVLAGGILP